MRRLIPALLLLLAACQTGDKPNAAAEAGPIAGPAVQTTSLDAPKADDKAAAQPDAKALAKALAALPDPMTGGVVDASSETGTAAVPVDKEKAKAAEKATEAPAETSAAPPAETPEDAAAKEGETEAEAPAPDETLDDALSEAEAEPEIPAALKSPEQRKCERQGGKFVTVGGNKALRTCVKRMRDANKSCDADSDCKGKCLARSRTCAPIDPLPGCNDILNDYGLVLRECVQ